MKSIHNPSNGKKIKVKIINDASIISNYIFTLFIYIK